MSYKQPEYGDGEWWVLPPGQWENALTSTIVYNWYAVGHDKLGIIAYFEDEEDAQAFLQDKQAA